MLVRSHCMYSQNPCRYSYTNYTERHQIKVVVSLSEILWKVWSQIRAALFDIAEAINNLIGFLLLLNRLVRPKRMRGSIFVALCGMTIVSSPKAVSQKTQRDSKSLKLLIQQFETGPLACMSKEERAWERGKIDVCVYFCMLSQPCVWLVYVCKAATVSSVITHVYRCV